MVQPVFCIVDAGSCFTDAHMCAEGQSKTKEAEAEGDGELPPVLQQLVRPVVHDAGDQGLHVAELAVDAEHEQHDEEDGGPDHRAGQGEHQVGVGEEDEAWSRVDDVVDGGAGDEGHVAEDGEHEDSGQQAGQRVHNARDDRVPVQEDSQVQAVQAEQVVCQFEVLPRHLYKQFVNLD